jgi:hypothetical protein
VTPVVARVPEVGKVMDVVPDNVPVKAYAPEKATLPAMVIVDEPLFTPVPPFVPESGPPDQDVLLANDVIVTSPVPASTPVEDRLIPVPAITEVMTADPVVAVFRCVLRIAPEDI